jgi:hypothetical protein
MDPKMQMMMLCLQGIVSVRAQWDCVSAGAIPPSGVPMKSKHSVETAIGKVKHPQGKCSLQIKAKLPP